MYITFSNPKYLFLLFVIPLFILIHLLSLNKSRRKALSFANFEAISRVKGVEFLSKNLTIFSLNIIIILLVIFSVSGITLHKQAGASSFSFILAIDASRSMEANDLEPTRLNAAKSISKEFVDLAPASTKIGVLSFSGNAYIHSPITENKNDIKEAINSIEISAIEGTDLYETVITSTNLLSQLEESKAMILLSDGQINVGIIEEAIDYANKFDVLIHTIAIGTEEGGKTIYGVSKVNKELLQALSYNTEGEFFDTENEKQISESFNRILKVTKKKVSTSLTSYFLLAAIALFMAQYVLTNIRYRIFP